MSGQPQQDPGAAGWPEVPPAGPTDEAAFEELHRDLDGNLHRYLTRRLPPDDRADVRQETWQSFYLAWMRNPAHPNPTALLFQIAYRRVADHHRQAGRTPSPLDSDDLQALIEALMMEVPQNRVDGRQDLKRALGRLTAQQRRALVLRHVDEMPVAAIAGVMGLGVDNTKRILKRAIRDLRDGMTGYYQAAAEPRREQK